MNRRLRNANCWRGFERVRSGGDTNARTLMYPSSKLVSMSWSAISCPRRSPMRSFSLSTRRAFSISRLLRISRKPISGWANARRMTASVT